MTTAILTKLRALMKDVGYNSKPIQALIVTNHDAHMSEYLADRDRRLKFISGFSGTAGTAVITENEALMWTDGRYFIQAAKEMDINWSLMKIGVFGTVSESTWLSSNLKEGSVVGTDPRHIPYSVWVNMQKELQQSNILLVPLQFNYIDEIWENKPLMPKTVAKTLDIKYTGKPASIKIEKICSVMQEKGVDLLILTALDDISWLLNLRGNDIAYNPVFFSFLIIHGESLHLFVDEDKITTCVISHFNDDHVKVQFHPYETFYEKINELANSVKKVWICRSANYKIYDTFPETKRYCECSPVTFMKAIKNDDEVQGMINAHIKDGVALCRYFSWLENEIKKEKLTEISAAKVLESFRQEEKDYIGPSFQTISSSGPNAAITHYMPSEDSDRPLTPKEIYLCDSGAQYLDGTTDVTRTFHYGEPSQFEKECFTRVFKGVVAIAAAIFPYGIKGNCLDSFARKALWDVGLDYKHGTGHGIGSYLFVHEGPMGISWRPYPDDPGLQPNMFLSDEPGYYHEGEFGIRIENIVRIIPTKTKYEMPLSEKGFLTFETITLCPIQSKMLITSKLTSDEIHFLNNYHKKVFDTLGAVLMSRGYTDAYNWLRKETAEIIKIN